MHTGSEQRSYYRADHPINLNIISINDQECYPRFSDEIGLNIGVRGMLIKVSQGVPLHARIKIQILLPDTLFREMFEAVGEVVWVRRHTEDGIKKYCLGVKFVEIARSHEDAIEQFITRLLLPD
ncbi:MAG: PilZ domain-containing protein [Candidatus Omnitrophica bacterium]|nr:PilZ domain-containing protein [Candidatus Omnitrophota bacterium]